MHVLWNDPENTNQRDLKENKNQSDRLFTQMILLLFNIHKIHIPCELLDLRPCSFDV